MRRLNPRNVEDRRHTAFVDWFEISVFPDGSVLMGAYSYDCWGGKQGGLFRQRRDAETAAKLKGRKNHITLELMQRGCCPPQLASQMLGDESETDSQGDPIEEAMLLHKRGYLGGGG